VSQFEHLIRPGSGVRALVPPRVQDTYAQHVKCRATLVSSGTGRTRRQGRRAAGGARDGRARSSALSPSGRRRRRWRWNRATPAENAQVGAEKVATTFALGAQLAHSRRGLEQAWAGAWRCRGSLPPWDSGSSSWRWVRCGFANFWRQQATWRQHGFSFASDLQPSIHQRAKAPPLFHPHFFSAAAPWAPLLFRPSPPSAQGRSQLASKLRIGWAGLGGHGGVPARWTPKQRDPLASQCSLQGTVTFDEQEGRNLRLYQRTRGDGRTGPLRQGCLCGTVCARKSIHIKSVGVPIRMMLPQARISLALSATLDVARLRHLFGPGKCIGHLQGR